MNNLQELNKFIILLDDGKNNLIDIIRKISLRQNIHFNWIKIDSQTTAILYDVDKSYIYNFGANKKLKFIWKDENDFYIVDFKNNNKGDIISYLTFESNSGETIEGDIQYINLKPLKNLPEQYKDESIKIPLVSSQQLDEQEPYIYEPFTIYIKNMKKE